MRLENSDSQKRADGLGTLRGQLRMWLYMKRMRLLSLQMEWSERIATFVAYKMPRQWAYWAFIRVATEDYKGEPGNQVVSEVQKRWIRNTKP